MARLETKIFLSRVQNFVKNISVDLEKIIKIYVMDEKFLNTQKENN